MIRLKFIIALWLSFTAISSVTGEDGYALWLRYHKIENKSIRKKYASQIKSLVILNKGEVANTAAKELSKGLSSMLDTRLESQISLGKGGGKIIVGTVENVAITEAINKNKTGEIKNEGYAIFSLDKNIYIAATDEKGLLYGAFHFLRTVNSGADISKLNLLENPKLKVRILNHWDNMDRTIERGYAGFSIFNWHQLPDYIDPRYEDYARANASIGINATVVTNVNANYLVFRPDYMDKFAALADIFRPYGIKLYLTARFSSPIELGGLKTADPLDPAVQQWWKEKTKEIYKRIPDFGGFLVKANSEGQPGPQEYNRTHADGANMLADAVAPFGGIVMWRAFVYSNEEPVDRAKQAYNEFVPLDGKFRKNVLVQVKNGPIDFQPREPIHPLFGAMPKTPVMMEFQITKEYLGQGTHLVGLSKMYEEVLKTDTYVKGKGSLVAKVIDGSLDNQELTGMAGVANIGNERNWTSNLFAQADWYAFGRLAWDPYMESKTIFQEWAGLTFDNAEVQKTAIHFLENSHEWCVKYMTPLGLHHIMAANHHFGPGPWVSRMSRADWTSVYYHKADSVSVGFDRSVTGTNALEQYSPEFATQYASADKTDLKFLLWFHHVPWNQKLSTGKTLWEEMCEEYNRGVQGVSSMVTDWNKLKGKVDEERFQQVAMHLKIQEDEAKWWRDACLSYFKTFSRQAIPAHLPQPEHDLKYYQDLNYPYSPGIRPRW